jgi:hypothetical protein
MSAIVDANPQSRIGTGPLVLEIVDHAGNVVRKPRGRLVVVRQFGNQRAVLPKLSGLGSRIA